MSTSPFAEPRPFPPRGRQSHRDAPVHSLLARLGHDEVVEGGYRLEFLVRRERNDRVPAWHARLADRSGILNVYLPAQQVQINACLPPHTLVFAGFETQLFEGRLVGLLRTLDALGCDPQPELALERIPRPVAHLPDALDRLAEVVSGLNSAPLRGALQRLFLEDALMLDWIARPDDLFARSVAAAMVAPEIVSPLFPEGSVGETALAACLMRPMGLLNVPDGIPPGHRRALARCARALDWLAGADPVAAGRLRRLLGDAGGRPEPQLMAILSAVARAEAGAGVGHPGGRGRAR